MRNSEVMKTVEAVNDVLYAGVATQDELVLLQKWARIGVEEHGGTAYRLTSLLASQLYQALSETTGVDQDASETTVDDDDAYATDPAMSGDDALLPSEKSYGEHGIGVMV